MACTTIIQSDSIIKTIHFTVLSILGHNYSECHSWYPLKAFVKKNIYICIYIFFSSTRLKVWKKQLCRVWSKSFILSHFKSLSDSALYRYFLYKVMPIWYIEIWRIFSLKFLKIKFSNILSYSSKEKRKLLICIKICQSCLKINIWIQFDSFF